jgi:hypothetical protein
MAHVHGTAAKSAAEHAHHAMNAAGSSHNMMQQMPAGHMMAGMPKHTGMAAMGTAAVAAATPQGRGFMGFLARHPLVVFGLGVAVGYMAHKYRKEIIQSAGSLTGDFSRRQRETLDDLVAECPECPGDEPSEGSGKSRKG